MVAPQSLIISPIWVSAFQQRFVERFIKKRSINNPFKIGLLLTRKWTQYCGNTLYACTGKHLVIISNLSNRSDTTSSYLRMVNLVSVTVPDEAPLTARTVAL